jgi:hypothetical protein
MTKKVFIQIHLKQNKYKQRQQTIKQTTTKMQIILSNGVNNIFYLFLFLFFFFFFVNNAGETIETEFDQREGTGPCNEIKPAAAGWELGRLLIFRSGSGSRQRLLLLHRVC